MKIIDKTKSICKKCGNIVPADIIMEKNKIYIEKKCPVHGSFKYQHVWDIPETYYFWKNLKFNFNNISNNLAVILTNSCNLNCNICYAKANKFEQPEFNIKNLNKLKDFNYIYLTGGEPTVRKDIFEIIKKLKKNKHKVAIFTNGIKIADKNFADKLKKSKVDFIYLQLDSLNPEYNKDIRGYDDTKIKKNILNNLNKHGIFTYPISLSIKRQTKKDIKNLIDYCMAFNNIIVLGFNPVWETGRYEKGEFTSTSDTMYNINAAIGTSVKDFLDSTRLLINIETLYLNYKKRRRRFGKCNMFFLFLYYKNKIIPINEVFDIKKINNTLEKLINEGKNYKKLVFLLAKLAFSEIFINFFTNKNFRKFVIKLILNLKMLFINKYLYSPFKIIRINSFPNYNNMDMNFAKTCNLLSISNTDSGVSPACIYRFKLNEN